MSIQSIRAQLLAIKTMADSILSELADDEIGECQHPEDVRVNASTMGEERWICSICGYQHGFDEEGD